MANTSPTVSQIRSAGAKAVGGGRKRCRKGKNCSATCIDSGKICLVELPESAGVATSKVARLIQSKKVSNISPASGGGAPAPQQDTAPSAPLSLQELSKRISQAKDDYEDAYGTPNQAAAKAKFDKAVDDYGKAKAAASGSPVAEPAKSTRGLSPEQDERVDKAAQMTNFRINKQINDRQFYDDVTNAKIKAQNEARMAPFQKMNADEKAALSLYGQDGVKFYAQVNQLLRSGQMEDSTPDKVKMAEFVSNNLRSGLEKLPPAKAEELGRAVRGGFATGLATLKPGDVIQDKGFGSYTDKGNPVYDQFFSKTQPNAVIRVLNPKTAREVAPAMEYSREGEHITLPGTRYRLVDVQEKGVYSRKTGGYIPQYTFEEVE